VTQIAAESFKTLRVRCRVRIELTAKKEYRAKSGGVAGFLAIS
jgi:hypothetical protein